MEARAVGLKNTMATIEKQREKVRQDYLSREIGGRAYTEMVSDLDQREAERLLTSPEAIEAETAFTLNNVDQVVGDAWERMAMSQRKQALRCLVPRLVAFRKKGSDDLDLDITVVTPEVEEPAVRAYHLVHGRSREMYGALTD